MNVLSHLAGEKCPILGGKVYLVGRRECDILVIGDATVSRKHAELTVIHPESNLVRIIKALAWT